MHTETQTPRTHTLWVRGVCALHSYSMSVGCLCFSVHTHVFTGFRARTNTHIHTCTPTPPHAGLCWRAPNAPHPLPYRLTLKRFFNYFLITITITRTASQVPELLCQWTDWINWKFYEVCGHPKWFSQVKSQYALSQCQHVRPYICFEGVVDLCSWLWLVVAVRQRGKRKGSINALSYSILLCWLHV